MRSLPFNTAASQCATYDLGMQPGSRSRACHHHMYDRLLWYLLSYYRDAALGSLASASFSSQKVPRLSMTYVTRTR
jgi:hypothetical protein